ncbi:hypothetical protein SAY87_016593 [Trapa incisa]|uniref:Uncharacterized protein n=1 Tax=Trapa incisa TaxID=236973 RepID=A0AAN7LHQ3_9MYRT|nr:hypothetical protein SAY87_016593 [Trapa incisa]
MLLLAAGCPKQQYLDVESYDEGGFLKLSKTYEWLAGEDSAPLNKKATSKLKRELVLLSVGVGTGCVNCLLVLSVQASISYSIGLLFRIGIRSEDLSDLLERSIKGIGMALSSARLVIPATIMGTHPSRRWI